MNVQWWKWISCHRPVVMLADGVHAILLGVQPSIGCVKVRLPHGNGYHRRVAAIDIHGINYQDVWLEVTPWEAACPSRHVVVPLPPSSLPPTWPMPESLDSALLSTPAGLEPYRPEPHRLGDRPEPPRHAAIPAMASSSDTRST